MYITFVKEIFSMACKSQT